MKRLSGALFCFFLGRLLFAQGLEGAATAAQVAGSSGLTDGVASPGFSFEELSRVPEGRALLAATTPDYPVTPGDVYTLAFLKASDLATTTLVVQSDYSVNLGVFGAISGKGLAFIVFKSLVEKRVAAAYPGSAPELIVRSTGTFQVYVSGEVGASGTSQSWALERLSTLYARIKTAHASERKVLVRGADGSERSYDLFRARRDGALAEDPYLRPGDRVILQRTSRQVQLKGAIYRPGTYEPLMGEGLRELVETYGAGLLPEARGDYAQVTRAATASRPEAEIVFFDAQGWTGTLPEVLDGDSVMIPNRQAYLPVVYFEGAIATGAEVGKQYATDRYPYKPGMLLSQALRAVAGRLAPNADLRRAFIARKGKAETIPVDLESLLYAYNPDLDLTLESEDRIVIPTGSLDVFVTGEVLKSTWVNTSALTRLSAAVGPLLTPYSSIRDILVRSAGGEERSFDLFRAERYGELAEDPFLKPGDSVTLRKAERIITLGGEVRRPGKYQLLPGEGLKELVRNYGAGFTERANPARLTLVRAPSLGRPMGETRYLSYTLIQSMEDDFPLESFDSINVPAMTELLPVVFFEGALGLGASGEDPQAARRIPYTFVPGDTLSRVVQALRKQFSAVSDLSHAYILRGDTHIPVNLELFLYEKNFQDDVPLEPNDVVIVPFRQFFITVSGAVKVPGRYPYVPDRTWEYYVGLAGGLDPEKNAGEALTITSMDGKKRTKTSHLEPEDSIVVKSNSFLYYFGKVSAILTTVISVASLVISLTK